MPRWLWFAPLAGVIAVTALLAYRQGFIAARISETDVIEAYAALYVRQQGGAARATDCTARPATDRAIWLVVTCLSARGERFDFPVDRLGRLVEVVPAKEAAHAPKT